MKMISFGVYGRNNPIALFLVSGLFLPSFAQQGPCEMAASLHSMGQITAALPEYDACLKVDPRNVQARSNFGAALAHEGRYADAIEQDRAALQIAPAPMASGIRLNLALAYYKAARMSEAAQVFEFILREDPANRRAAILLAECELILGAPAKSIAYLQPLEAAAPNDLTVIYLLGSAFLRSGDIEKGQQMLDRILRNGESAEGHMLLGVSMLQAGDYPGAVREFAKTESLQPDLPSLHAYYGQALLNTGDATAAVAAFQRELQTNASDFDANLRLGQIFLARKQFESAIPLLEHATRMRPDSAEALEAFTNARGHRAGVSTAQKDGPAIGSAAPPFRLRSVRDGQPESLSGILRHKPLVAIFGSYTCPQLRAAVPVLNQLYSKFGGQVSFALIYVSEAHGSGTWQSTANQRENIDLPTERTSAEKQDHAALCLRKLSIPYLALVDTMDRAAEKAYSAWPSRVFVIGRDQRIRFQTRLSELDFDRDALERSISQLVPPR